MSEFDPYAPVPCPMPECSESLYLSWSASAQLTANNLVEGKEPPRIDEADSVAWRVECLRGHVVLLPGKTGCPCDDPGGEDCPHNGAAADDYDRSDELRTFRGHDADRLIETIQQVANVEVNL